MAVVQLTQAWIDANLFCPEGKKKIELVSSDRSGLYISVNEASNGVGTYFLRYKDVNNKSCHQKIGRTSDMTLAAAKEAVKTLKAEIALGADPRAEEKSRLAVITYDAFFDEYYLPYAKTHKRSWGRDEELYRLRIQPAFGTRRLNDVTRLQIQKFHAKLMNEGLAAATANHHIKLIRRMLNLAIEWSIISGPNPASRIQMFAEDNQIERYMGEAELQRLLEVLRTDKRQGVCRIALFLLSTGARLNEALSAKWERVDVEKRIWRVPATNSKSKRMRAIPLNDAAMAEISALDTKGEYEHLFINKRTKLPYVNIAKVWEDLREKAGLPKLRLHDLRHQFASFLVNDGQSLYTVQQILGHSDPSVTQRYAHLSVTALQNAANSASKQIQSAKVSKAA
ncbi:Site-specific recombinase XerD [Methylophilus rhizosphaerae]|uniref:Site-specific recombinase XerD n=1 Tax=Methylophilus rhizosphaerae TaxID=492660 RepID=A0A1G9CPN4_9PROT|nr:site-specific integrase [Methylophilus rhizosphaerae]SDK53588.1 Site-specific recombinase XerD [Methylophilus rhizosphaerae]